MRQIHCVIDCLAYALHEHGGFDTRPLYFGVWNTPFAVTDSEIAYYSKSIGTEEITEQFRLLFGGAFDFWIDYGKDKAYNFFSLESRMAGKNEHQVILTLVDLFYLPHSPSFGKKHRPHILIADGRKEDGWHLIDPYFSWMGAIPHDVFHKSFCCGDLMVGITLDMENLRQPQWSVVSECFAKSFNPGLGRFVEEVQKMVERTLSQDGDSDLKALYASIEQAGVISKRWAGYEMAFAYFASALGRNPAAYEGKAVDLTKKWESMLLSAVRMGITGNRDLLPSLVDKVRRIGEAESSIKSELRKLFDEWMVNHAQPG